MTSTSKIFLGNVIVALLTAFAVVWFRNDLEILFLTVSQLVSSDFGYSQGFGTLVVVSVGIFAAIAVWHVFHAFVFKNHLFSFFYQIPIPARN